MEPMHHGFWLELIARHTRGINVSQDLSASHIGHHNPMINRPKKVGLFLRAPTIPHFHPVRGESDRDEVSPFLPKGTLEQRPGMEKESTLTCSKRMKRLVVRPVPVPLIEL
jgi:hypothetical protein